MHRDGRLATDCRTNTSEVCEGKGQCVCGVCDCYPVLALEDPSKKYSGTYCQCDDYACDYYEGQLCGGTWRLISLARFLCQFNLL